MSERCISEREAFEHFMNQQPQSGFTGPCQLLDDGKYKHLHHEAMWKCWQTAIEFHFGHQKTLDTEFPSDAVPPRGGDFSSPGFRATYAAGVLTLYRHIKTAISSLSDKGENIPKEEIITLLRQAFKTTNEPLETGAKVEAAHILDTSPTQPQGCHQNQHMPPILDGLRQISENPQRHSKRKGQ